MSAVQKSFERILRMDSCPVGNTLALHVKEFKFVKAPGLIFLYICTSVFANRGVVPPMAG